MFVNFHFLWYPCILYIKNINLSQILLKYIHFCYQQKITILVLLKEKNVTLVRKKEKKTGNTYYKRITEDTELSTSDKNYNENQENRKHRKWVKI